MPIYKIEASQSLHLGKIDISNTQSIHIGYEKLDTAQDVDNRINTLRDVVNITSPNYPNEYPNDSDVTETIYRAGALRMRVHFADFDCELNYDYVYILDKNDTVIYTYNGNDLGAFYSGWVDGDTLKIRFTSDGSVKDRGYYVDLVEYEGVFGLKLSTTGSIVNPNNLFKLDTIGSIVNPNSLFKLDTTQDIHFSTTITTTQDIHTGSYRRVTLQSIADTDWSTAFERGVEPIIIIRSKH